MKKIFYLFFIIALSHIAGAVNVHSETAIEPDSIKTGVSYKFVLYNDTEVIGKVISVDSVFIVARTEQGTYRLLKDDILLISYNMMPRNYSAQFFFGGGTGFLTSWDYGPVYDEFTNNFALHLSYIIPISENKGIRLDAGYTHWKNDSYTYRTENNSWIEVFDDYTKDVYTLKADYVYGMVSAETKFWICGTAGLGLNFSRDGEYENSYSFYDYQDSAYVYRSYHTNANNQLSLAVSAGCLAGYRFSKKLGIYIDAQYIVASGKNFFTPIFGIGTGYFPVRAGITYTMF